MSIILDIYHVLPLHVQIFQKWIIMFSMFENVFRKSVFRKSSRIYRISSASEWIQNICKQVNLFTYILYCYNPWPLFCTEKIYPKKGSILFFIIYYFFNIHIGKVRHWFIFCSILHFPFRSIPELIRSHSAFPFSVSIHFMEYFRRSPLVGSHFLSFQAKTCSW